MAETLKAKALIQLGLDTKPLDDGKRDARRKLADLVDVKGLVKKMAIGNIIGNAISGGIGKLTDMFGDAATEAMDFERSMTRMQISGDRSSAGMSILRLAIGRVSKETSMARGSLLAGAQAYVTLTGDMEGATKQLETFAKVSIATATDVAEVAKVAAALGQSLKIDPSDIEHVFDTLVVQGKAGAVELNDLASLLPKIAADFKRFKGGASKEGAATMGAMMQTAFPAYGNAAETATGFKAFMNGITRSKKKFGKNAIVIKVKGKEQMLSYLEILDNIAKSRAAQDSTKLQELLSPEGAKFFKAEIDARKELLRLEALAQTSAGKTDADFDTYIKSPAGRMEMAMNTLKLAIADTFTPARLMGFAKALEKIVDGASKLVGFFQYMANGQRTDYEVASDLQDEEIAGIKKRRREILVEQHGHLLGPRSDPAMKGLRGWEETAGDKARKAILAGEGSAAEAQIRAMASAGGSDIDKQITEQMARETRLAGAFGGATSFGIGNEGKQATKDLTIPEILGATKEIMSGTTGAPRERLLKLQQEALARVALAQPDALGKAVVGQLDKINLIIKQGKDEAAKTVKQAPIIVTKPGGRI